MVSPEPPVRRNVRPDAPHIALSHVRKVLGGRPVLDDACLSIPKGSLTFLVGRSGAGKSVLSRCAVGLYRVDEGEVLYDGHDISHLSESQLTGLRSTIPYVVQGSALVDWLSLRENLVMSLGHASGIRLTKAERLQRANQALEQVGVLDVADARPSELGGGDLKLAAIARALALRPRGIFYDEPTTGLDPEAARRVDDLIRRHAVSGTTGVVVSHDLSSIRRIADRVALLDGGRIAFSGPVEDFFDMKDRDPAIHRFFHQAEG